MVVVLEVFARVPPQAARRVDAPRASKWVQSMRKIVASGQQVPRLGFVLSRTSFTTAYLVRRSVDHSLLLRNAQIRPQCAAFVKYKAAACIVRAVGLFKVFEDAAFKLVDVL